MELFRKPRSRSAAPNSVALRLIREGFDAISYISRDVGASGLHPNHRRCSRHLLEGLEPHVERGATAVLTQNAKRLPDGVLEIFRPSHLASEAGARRSRNGAGRSSIYTTSTALLEALVEANVDYIFGVAVPKKVVENYYDSTPRRQPVSALRSALLFKRFDETCERLGYGHGDAEARPGVAHGVVQRADLGLPACPQILNHRG